MDTISIIGIGNMLMCDEGFGVHVIHYLEENYIFPDFVRLVDCGTAGIYMAPFFEDADRVIIVDVVQVEDEAPGTVLSLRHGDMMARSIQSSMSPHQIGVLEILEICKLRGNIPQQVEFCLVVPEKLEPGLELSKTLASRVPEVAENIVEDLRSQGFQI